MKRFASLDFMRGTAILLMILLHVVDQTLDTDTLFSNIEMIPLFNILVLLIFPFLGGLAGFFLLTSATSNMVSMYKLQMRGLPTKTLVVRQVLTGVMIVFFAMLIEGLIGYNGAFGLFVRDLGGPLRMDAYITRALSRWNHFETIHTIGWCVIMNGIIQGVLSRKDQWKNVPAMIRNYAIIAVAVLALTIPVWVGVGLIVPGYPWAYSPASGLVISMPKLGVDNFGYILVSPFLAMIAAPKEPLFPYLAVSCIGSIIGLVMCQQPERIPRNFVKKMTLIGLVAFIIGVVGIGVTIMAVAGGAGLEAAVNMYVNLSFHRSWFPDNFESNYAAFLNIFSWLWQFLATNGFSLMFSMMTIFLVDWRGKGPDFANNRYVQYVRRFGFISLTNYNNQWIIFAVWIAVSTIFTGQRRVKLMWDGTLTALAATLIIFTLMLTLWEKFNYTGSLEWIMRTVGLNLIPAKRDEEIKKKWYEKGDLNVKDAFYNVEWVSVVTPDDNYHEQLRDSKMISKLAKISFFSIIFMPFNIVTLIAARDIQKRESKNPALKWAIIISTAGSVITISFFVASLFLTLKMLGA